jgi:hypothetical protein
VKTPKPELPAHLRGAQSSIHNAHAIRDSSIKPVRPPENPDTLFMADFQLWVHGNLFPVLVRNVQDGAFGAIAL